MSWLVSYNFMYLLTINVDRDRLIAVYTESLYIKTSQWLTLQNQAS